MLSIMNNHLMRNLGHALGRYLLIAAACLLSILPAHADFALNFLPNQSSDTTNAYAGDDGWIGSDNDQGNSCGITGYDDSGCFWFRNEAGTKFDLINQQPFRVEAVSSADGEMYWHVLLGNVDDQWKQDTWIRMGASQAYMEDGGTAATYQATLSNGNTRLSSSGGFAASHNDSKNQIGGSYGQMNATDPIESEVYAGNGADPLKADNTWSGNGSANPTRVIMRQIDNSPDAYQEFLKDSFDKKPLIYQEVKTSDVISLFQADMRGIDYNTSRALTIGTSTITPPTDPTIPGNGNSTGYFGAPANADYAYNPGSEFVLQLTLPLTPGVGTGFDAAGGRPVVGGALTGQNMTAGQFTWAAGNGWEADVGQETYYDRYYSAESSQDFTQMPIYSQGTYTYANGGYDVTAEKWIDYLDPLQSPCGGSPWCP